MRKIVDESPSFSASVYAILIYIAFAMYGGGMAKKRKGSYIKEGKKE